MIQWDALRHRLLRAHVEHGAHEVAADRQALLALEASEAKVEDAELALNIEDQVGGLYITVDDALRMRVLETVRDVGKGFRQSTEIRDLVLGPERRLRLGLGILGLARI